MSKRTIINNLGKIVVVISLLMLIPMFISLGYGEKDDALRFLTVLVPAFIVGFLCSRVKCSTLHPRDGYVIVASAWIVISVICAFPFYFSGAFSSYWAALFEIVSGFTTTGASVLAKPEVLGHGMQFFRCFSHWIGGMGVLVFVLMLLPMENDTSMHLIRAEVPGPTAGKLVPRMKNTSRILYGIYAAMTAILAIVLVCEGMPLFDALCYAFGTAGTGGFGINSQGFSIYANSHAIEYTIAIGMLLFGINFNIYFLIILKKLKAAFSNEEVKTYFGIVLAAVLAISINLYSTVGNFADAFRLSFFQVSSIITTTGFSTADFGMWPQFSQHLLVGLMIIGACAGSTAGGMKVSRIIILWKSFIAEIKRAINPKQMMPLRVNGEVIENRALQGTKVYCVAYFFIVCLSILIMALSELDFTTNVTAVLACFNNIGPGLSLVGPAANYSVYADPFKVFLSLLMLTGRLEIFPMFMFFAKSAHDR